MDAVKSDTEHNISLSRSRSLMIVSCRLPWEISPTRFRARDNILSANVLNPQFVGALGNDPEFHAYPAVRDGVFAPTAIQSNPHDEHQGRVPQLPGDLPGRAQNAGTNRGADSNRNAEPRAQHAK